MHAVDLRLVHDTGLLGAGKRRLLGPFRRQVHTSLVLHFGNGKWLNGPPLAGAFIPLIDAIEGLLGAIPFRSGSFRGGQSVVVRELELLDVLFGLCQGGAALRDLELVEGGVDTE
jgi:hypothetical protein